MNSLAVNIEQLTLSPISGPTTPTKFHEEQNANSPSVASSFDSPTLNKQNEFKVPSLLPPKPKQPQTPILKQKKSPLSQVKGLPPIRPNISPPFVQEKEKREVTPMKAERPPWNDRFMVDGKYRKNGDEKMFSPRTPQLDMVNIKRQRQSQLARSIPTMAKQEKENVKENVFLKPQTPPVRKQQLTLNKDHQKENIENMKKEIETLKKLLDEERSLRTQLELKWRQEEHKRIQVEMELALVRDRKEALAKEE